jgi:release factor glutamine methyltransferase
VSPLPLDKTLRRWEAALRSAGSDEAQTEARLLAAHFTGLPLGDVPLSLDRPLDDDVLAAADAILADRARHVPLPYLLGDAWFLGLRFRVDPRVLIPRPETELLAEAAIAWLRTNPKAAVADIGTGSGCLALSIAHFRPACRVYATDLSDDALALARENAADLGVADRVTLLQGDLLGPLRAEGIADSLEAVISNPPYVTEAEYADAQPELLHEPRGALVAGPTGFEVMDRLVAELATLPNLRFVGLEIGATQGPSALLLARENLPDWRFEVRGDYAGHDRLLIGTRP